MRYAFDWRFRAVVPIARYGLGDALLGDLPEGAKFYLAGQGGDVFAKAGDGVIKLIGDGTWVIAADQEDPSLRVFRIEEC